MYGVFAFGSASFADFFNVGGFAIQYTFRKGRTIVQALIPENGNILTDTQSKFIRTSVIEVAPDNSKASTLLNNSRIIKTKILGTKGKGGSVS
jgi:ribosome-binding ATPase YchF (GTP1/OBG family)